MDVKKHFVNKWKKNGLGRKSAFYIPYVNVIKSVIFRYQLMKPCNEKLENLQPQTVTLLLCQTITGLLSIYKLITMLLKFSWKCIFSVTSSKELGFKNRLWFIVLMENINAWTSVLVACPLFSSIYRNHRYTRIVS